MNRIAVLTDLSSETAHACFYALKMAVRMKADVQLFNVSITEKAQQPALVIAGEDAGAEDVDDPETNDFCKSIYADFEHRCFTGTFQPTLSCEVVIQSAADVMMQLMEVEHTDLIIIPLPAGQTMTAFGQSAVLKSIMDLATVPVLIVPDNGNTQYFEKIAYCTGDEPRDAQHILSLVDLMKPLSPEIMVASLTLQNAASSVGKTTMQAVKKGTEYGRIYHRDIMPADYMGSWKWLNNNKKCDLLAITQMPKAAMDTFFNQGETLAATWHINIPLLVFPAWNEV